MPFKEASRRFWQKVNNGKCAYESYSEEGGFRECGRPAKHTHHIVPEGKQLAEGDDPEYSIGMPLCEEHHTRNLGSDEHTQDFSFHPDMGRAYRKYREWKQRKQHMEALTGRRFTEPSPFEEAAKEHARKRENGDRYHAGTEEIDRHYLEKMQNKATAYIAEHPEEKRKKRKPHPQSDPTKKKRWYDGLF
jgi:hypothetical protein